MILPVRRAGLALLLGALTVSMTRCGGTSTVTDDAHVAQASIPTPQAGRNRLNLKAWRDAELARQIQAIDRQLSRGNVAEALQMEFPESPVGRLLRARALRLSGQPDQSLVQARWKTRMAVSALRSIELGLAYLEAGEDEQAFARLGAYRLGRWGNFVQIPWAEAASRHRPDFFLSEFDRTLENTTEIEDRAQLWMLKAHALEALARSEEAREARREVWTRFPHVETGVELGHPSRDDILKRAEALLEAHQNEQAVRLCEDAAFTKGTLEACRLEFVRGVGLRKLRRYAAAETALSQAVASCAPVDPDRERRASYLLAKVVSIRDGLRAVPLIEAFVVKFRGHSMADDVLFWAGDLYQRRKKWQKADAYFRRVATYEPAGDHCAEALWRLGWTRHRRGQRAKAIEALRGILDDSTCKPETFDRARARYWLAQWALEGRDFALARTHAAALLGEDPFGFYAQLLLAERTRLGTDETWVPEVVTRRPKAEAPDRDGLPPGTCLGWLRHEPAFWDAVDLLEVGLHSDAASILRRIAPPKQTVMARAHANSLGVAAQKQEVAQATGIDAACTPSKATMLLAFAMHEAGAHHEAHWRLRTELRDQLSSVPRAEDLPAWFAAYPLAYRDLIAKAEQDNKIPTYLLQALAREESALDAEIVSWAGAYGLTQLLEETARGIAPRAGMKLTGSVKELLLKPEPNARLGGALLGQLLEKLGGSEALALAAYNAGESAARAWRRRHKGDSVGTLAEEITIEETRGYVKRVLRTYGVYRWLYGDAPLAFAGKTLVP